MSLFNDASLVMIPSGYKTSKVYSVKPDTGAGDLVFSRSNDTATRVGPDGLIEKVRTNICLQSQTFDNASWVKVASGTASAPVVTANAGVAPDGTTTADRVVFSATSGVSIIAQDVTGAIGYTFSIYVKSNTGSSQSIQLRVDSAPSTIITATTEWQRFTVKASSWASAIRDVGLDLRTAVATSADLLVWGAQWEASDIATDYIATTTAAVSVGPVANVPRLDYLNSSCPRLLLEPQRTNLFQYSEQLDNAYWSKIGAITVTANNAVSPDGYQNADLVTTTSTSRLVTTTSTSRIQRAFTGLTAGTRTLSCFAKAGTSNLIRINSFDGSSDRDAEFNLATGQVVATGSGITATITPYGNGWYRITHTQTSANTTYSCQFFFDGAGTWQVWGMQFEDSASYATSYVPSLGAAVTRGADNTSLNPATLLGATTGSWYSEIDNITFEFSGTSVPTNYIGGDATNLLGYEARSGNNKLIHFVKEESNAVTTLYSFTPTGKHKACFVWSGTSLKLFVDGVKRYDAGSFVQPAAWDEFQYNFSGREAQQYLNQTLLFPTALSDADAIALTA